MQTMLHTMCACNMGNVTSPLHTHLHAGVPCAYQEVTSQHAADHKLIFYTQVACAQLTGPGKGGFTASRSAEVLGHRVT